MDKNQFISETKKLGFDTSEFIVIGSGLLAALELRKVDDIDLVVSEKIFELFANNPDWSKKKFDDGTFYLCNGIYEIGLDWDSTDTLPNLDDLKLYEIVIGEVPFINPQRLIKWKKWKGRKKDFEDIKLIEQYLSN